MKRKKSLLTYLPLIALIISLVFNYKQYDQNQTQIEENRQQRIALDSVKYLENGLIFRPRLELIGNPIIKNMHLTYDKEIFNPLFTPDSIINDSTAIFDARLTLTVSFQIKNKGNALAKIQFQSAADTFSSVPVLKMKLFEQLKNNNAIREYFDDYTKLDIGENDSLVINTDFIIACAKDGDVNLHFMVLYENEFGHLYDTYIWAVFDNAIPTLFRSKVVYDEKSDKIIGVLEGLYKQPNKFSCRIVNTEFNFYDKSTATIIKNFINELKVEQR